MNEISSASEETSKIIKTIEESRSRPTFWR